MASSSVARLPLLLLLVVLLLLSSLSSLAASEPQAEEAARAPALPPAGRARQDSDVAAAAVPRTGQPGAGMAKDGAGRRPIRGRRMAGRSLGGGTGAWAFSAMLPRRFVPPSGSSACHNDMPATVADSQFSPCGGAGSP